MIVGHCECGGKLVYEGKEWTVLVYRCPLCQQEWHYIQQAKKHCGTFIKVVYIMGWGK